MWQYLLFLMFIGSQGVTVTNHKRIPLRYETPIQQSLSSTTDSKVFIARLNCPNIKGAEVIACAELPSNWQWNRDQGIVKMSLFNQKNTDNASLALNTTDKGPEKPLLQCTSVKSWSGGDLYVKVTPGLIVPVDYTLNIEVVPSNTPSTDRIVENTPYQNGVDVEELLPIAIHKTITPMPYDSNLLLEMDVCLESYSKLTIDTSVMSDQGTFSHVICSGPCESPDDERVICKDCNTALPVCVCETNQVPGGVTKVYARIHAASGVKNTTTGQFESVMRFGASFAPK